MPRVEKNLASSQHTSLAGYFTIRKDQRWHPSRALLSHIHSLSYIYIYVYAYNIPRSLVHRYTHIHANTVYYIVSRKDRERERHILDTRGLRSPLRSHKTSPQRERERERLEPLERSHKRAALFTGGRICTYVYVCIYTPRRYNTRAYMRERRSQSREARRNNNRATPDRFAIQSRAACTACTLYERRYETI